MLPGLPYILTEIFPSAPLDVPHPHQRRAALCPPLPAAPRPPRTAAPRAALPLGGDRGGVEAGRAAALPAQEAAAADGAAARGEEGHARKVPTETESGELRA